MTLPISLTDETVPQEAIWLVPWVAHDGEQPDVAWKFAREHISQLLGRTEEFRRNTYVPAIMSAFNDAAHADELEQYVRDNAPKGMTKPKNPPKGCGWPQPSSNGNCRASIAGSRLKLSWCSNVSGAGSQLHSAISGSYSGGFTKGLRTR